MKTQFLLSFCLFFSVQLFGQTPLINYSDIIEGAIKNKTFTITSPSNIPTTFTLTNSNTLSKELLQQFPSIHSYKGFCPNNPSIFLRLDINEKGFNGWVSGTEEFFFKSVDQKHLSIFSGSDYKKTDSSIEYHEDLIHRETTISPRKVNRKEKSYSGTLRVYRLAVACTGEYTNYHGGTKSLSLAAIATTINRVNEVFERDLGIRLEIIPNNASILYLDPQNDPFTNDSPSRLIDESQETIDDIIGTDNYDIGHTFSTEGGGLADWASVCGSFKAGGITGTMNPIGDPFDIDYVAHEIGHQFGADHTFNSESENCNGTRENGDSYEVGSGTTIMAYAGLCSPHNVQQISSPYFHTHSIETINDFLQGNGGTCGTIIQNGNTAPVINLEKDFYYLPTSTPFELSSEAIDAEDTLLTYCWEEYTLGTGGDAINPDIGDPLFRSFSPTANNYRLFPQASDILSNTSTFGETLPWETVSKDFRLTVRDNHPNGGGTTFEKVVLHFTSTPNPFIVTSQPNTTSYTAGETIEVTWDIANTDEAPINTSKVMISLSLDGGNTFTKVLSASTDNDGQATVQLPSILTSEARIKISAIGNVFFNINAANFSIIEPSYPSFGITTLYNTNEACDSDTIKITIQSSSFNGYNTPINLSLLAPPTGIGYIFSENPILPGGNAELRIYSTGYSGLSSLSLNTNSDTIIRNKDLSIRLHNNTPLESPILESPANDAIDISAKPTLNWEEVTQADNYTIKISPDPNLTPSTEYLFIDDNSFLLPEILNSSTTYYWQVKSINNCSQSDFSEIYNFETIASSCTTYTSDDTPLSLPNGISDFYSSIIIADDGIVTDINLPSVQGTHDWTSDLYFSLVSPAGTTTDLMGYTCSGNSSEDFNIGFDDQSTLGLAPCPPTDAKIYRASQFLSNFNGESMSGSWQLHLYDEFPNADQGVLQNWELEVCFENEIINGLDKNIHHYCYPNPVTNQLYFNTNASFDEVSIFNQLGVLILTTTERSLNVSEFESGVYFYLLKSSSSELRGKFIKQK